MNKKHILFGILFILIIGGAIGGRKFLAPQKCAAAEGKEVVINMMALKNQWKWVPNPVYVNCGDHVTINLYNEDEYDHGFALDVYGINKRMPPLTTTTVEFIATNEGEFIFYCSVPCGPGHFEQKGKLIVGQMIGR